MQMNAVSESSSRRTLLTSAWGGFHYRIQKTAFKETPLWCDLAPAEWLFRKMGQNVFMQTASWLVSRELTETVGPWDRRLSYDDDGEYFARMVRASDGIRFIPQGKVFYRCSVAGSLSYIGQSRKKLESLLLSMQLHIDYLRSLEDSERVRVACLNYLRDNFPYFYPENSDLVLQLQQMAAKLNGELLPPRLSWKYAWIQKTLGWTAAKRSQMAYNRWKTSALRLCDRTFFP
jgi:hypothetical protein